MEQKFDVFLDDNAVGDAWIKKEGLYYSFYSFIRPEKKQIYKLVVAQGVHAMELGIFVPKDDGFALFRKIPAKNFKMDEFRFSVISKTNENDFVPISEDTEFLFWEALENSRFVVKNGTPGIVFNQKR